jgi:hypothetical protein
MARNSQAAKAIFHIVYYLSKNPCSSTPSVRPHPVNDCTLIRAQAFAKLSDYIGSLTGPAPPNTVVSKQIYGETCPIEFERRNKMCWLCILTGVKVLFDIG